MNTSKLVSRMPHRRLLSVALATGLLVAAPQLFAQSTSATIRGQVSADSAPATDASVTATNTQTGLTRTVQATPSGSYSLAGLPPGTYRLDVTAGGKTSTKDITVQIGQTATVNLGVGGVAESSTAGPTTDLGTVNVTAVAAVETKTSEVATYVSQKQIDALPQGSRNFLAFADLVPGVIFETRSDGTSQLRSGGQNSNGINVFIDGIGQKNYVLKGGISGQDSSKGNPFPQLAIGEYKVITSNYKAEYDQISSAAVTAVTKSGTNEFHGSLFFDRSDSPQWSEPTPSEKARGVRDPSGSDQYGAALGGPIIKDTLFFFGTYEAKSFSLPREVRVGTDNFPTAALTPELASYLGGTSIPFKEDLYFGKLTWQLGDANLIELSAKQRKEEEITDIGNGPNVSSYGKTQLNESKRYDLRWQFSSENWLNDFHLTREDDTFNPRAISLENGKQIKFNRPRNANDPEGATNEIGTILNLGGGQDFQDKGQKGTGLQNDLTFNGWENHTVKMGVKYKQVEINSFEQQPFNPQFSYDYIANLAAGRTTVDSFIPYAVRFGAPLPGIGDRNITSKNKQYGIYLQDDWVVNNKLTLNLGIRYDYEKTPSYENYVTPGANAPCDPAAPTSSLACSLRNWSNLTNADYDIEDYISNGKNRKAFKDAIQPRVGFSYDLFEDQRHVIFGGAGRAYDRNLFDYLALEVSKSTFPSYTLNFNTENHPCTVGTNNCFNFDPSLYDRNNLYARVAANPALGSEVNLINNDLKVPFSDQFSIGMRNTVPVFGTDWNTSAAVARIESYDGILFTLGNRYPDGTFFPPGNTFGGAPFGQPIPGFGTLIIADNAIETRITQLLLSADKPFTKSSPWGVTLAYTYSDSKENRGNAANGDEHYSFDYPNLDNVSFVRSVGISKHRLVGTGIAEYWGLTFSTKVTVASAPGKDGLDCFNPNGCSNGSFNTYYFNGARFFQWDLAVQKEWDTGSALKAHVRADVFNVTNRFNYSQFETFRGDQNGPNPNFGNRNGLDIAGPTRTLKLSFGLDW